MISTINLVPCLSTFASDYHPKVSGDNTLFFPSPYCSEQGKNTNETEALFMLTREKRIGLAENVRLELD